MRRIPSTVARVAAGSFACALVALFVASIVGPVTGAAADSTPATPLPSSSITITRNVTYTDADGTTLTLDVYQPEEAATGRPGVMLIHGGAWGSGQAKDLDTDGRLIAREGWVAFSINYRLADQSSQPWPDELIDVQRAIRWISANADEYGVDNQKLVAMGFSAGGHLASLLAEVGTTVDGLGRTIKDPNPPAQVKAVDRPVAADRAVRPGQHGRRGAAGLHRQQDLHPLLAPAARDQLHRLHARRSARQSYDQASLVARATPLTVPIWFANSTNEIVGLPQAEAFDEALTKARRRPPLRTARRLGARRRVPSPGLEPDDGVGGGQGRSGAAGPDQLQ